MELASSFNAVLVPLGKMKFGRTTFPFLYKFQTLGAQGPSGARVEGAIDLAQATTAIAGEKRGKRNASGKGPKGKQQYESSGEKYTPTI